MYTTQTTCDVTRKPRRGGTAQERNTEHGMQGPLHECPAARGAQPSRKSCIQVLHSTGATLNNERRARRSPTYQIQAKQLS